MPTPSKDRLHGTLDALVLKTLSWGPRHGYGISRWLRETSSDAIQVEEGSLYPALYRMEREGWIEAEWGTSELGRACALRLTAQDATVRARWRGSRSSSRRFANSTRAH